MNHIFTTRSRGSRSRVPATITPMLPVLLLLVASCWGQSPQQPNPQPKPGTGDIGIQVQPASPPAQKKISPEEAQQLFASVDEIMTWLSADTGFAIKQKVKRELASRDQVTQYVESRLSEDEDAKRLQRSEIVLKKFGLLPRSFDLHAFLVNLLREQVAGYYDVRTKTVYLLDWLVPDAQRPVLAHELTHALQDQNFDLKKWEHPPAPKGANKNQYDYDEDEASTARSAVAEGQGMVTLVDYMLRESGHTVADSPQIVAGMKAAMSSNTGFPLLQQAPLMIRESLVFPYGDGLMFEGGLLQRGNKDFAFSGPFRRPPQDTHEVLDLAAYLNPQPPPWLPIPDLHPVLGPAYEKYDVGSVGQLDTRILAEQYSTPAQADKLAEAWRGGSYYAAGRKDPNLSGTTKVALLYLSRWSSEEAATEFSRVYAEYIPKRYSKVKSQRGLDRCAGQMSTQNGPPAPCDATFQFETEEGPVMIRRIPGPGVLITEGFDAETASKIEQRVLAANGKALTVERHSLLAPLRTSAAIQEALGNMLMNRIISRFTIGASGLAHAIH